MLVDAEDKDEWQEEVLHRPQTADLVRTLLCQTEPREGSYHYISDVDGCAILSLLWNARKGQKCFFPALTQLNTVRPRARDKVIASLVLRARHIAEIAVGKRHGLGPEFVDEDDFEDKLHCAARSLSTLTVLALNLMSDPALSCIFLKHNIIFEYAPAFFVLSKGAHSHYMETRGGANGTLSSDPQEARVSQAIWATIAAMLSGSFRTILTERARRSNSAVSAAISGGLLQTILRCFIHLLPNSRELNALIDDALPIVLRSVQTKKGIYSLSTAYAKHFSSDSAGGDELSALMDLA
ncbi:hypothetical protein FA13DRAFT_1804358 [Coprinellus micaceus]|uniref:Uncharacterized protein n=1 Tax=Coprinellus micaceus TaxID=71717 RepID=A0A4Y7S7N9_COPMI|nr:hypothetical protein FA13DRAFT_1804358 [Coprinellus micaceus]